VNARERWFALALRAYPRAYRAERGNEVMTTLVESTETASWWSVGADGLDLIVQGMRVRMALGPDRYAGRVLMLAALPGFVMAAAYAVVQLAFGEVAPTLPTHFGPFQTVGAAVYFVWILGALGALVKPRYQQRLAAICILASAVSVPVGDAFFARPLLRVLVVLVGLGLPSLLAPSADLRSSRSRTVAAGAGIITLSLLIPLAASGESTRFPVPFSPMEMFRLDHYLPYVAAAGAAAARALVIVRRTDLLGAGALVFAPWFVAGAVSPYYGGPRWSNNGFDALVLCIVAVWLGTTWVRDLCTPQLPGNTTESGHLG
jgi:hypothetical protein